MTDHPGMPLYTTHNGGGSWTADPAPITAGQKTGAGGEIIAFGSGAGEVYLVTAQCAANSCTDFRLWRSPVTADTWTYTALPFIPHDAGIDLEIHARSVWLLGTPAEASGSSHDELARSVDDGRTFTTGPGPCTPDLGGLLEPVSATDVWAVCPTGLMAGAWRSVDGGVTFSEVNAPSMPNSALIGAANSTTAVLAAGAQLSRTTNGGATWTPASAPSGRTFCAWIGFTDAEVGAAVVETTSSFAGNVSAFELWRTSDAGATWTVVHFG
jgi:hypothetical protein